MSARFLLTFDCEGRWGVADHLTARDRRQLTEDRLQNAYRSIVQLLDEYGVEATFGFVGAFAQSRADFARLRPTIEALRSAAPDYLGPALMDIEASGGNGWHGADLLDLVTGARTQHEIALHGVTHVPWTKMDEHTAETEMRLFEALSGPVRNSRTFIYPRNLVAHRHLLEKHGFAGYRTSRPRSRLRSFLSEFNIFEQPQHPLQSGKFTRIPAGFFLNWRSGLRALVPAEVTRLRARRLLRVAAEQGGVVHYWLHPENIAKAPSTLQLLRMLLSEVAEAREAGRLEVVTQLGYCER